MESLILMEKPSMMGSSQLLKIMCVNTIGMAIVVDAFKCASKMFMETGNRIKRNEHAKYQHDLYPYSDCKESLAFVKGTGLEMILEEYEIPLNPETLRATFFTMFDRRDQIE